MTVDHERAGAEGFEAPLVDVEVPTEIGRPALPEPVDVRHHDEVGQFVIGRLVDGFPDRALGELAVAAEHPDPERKVLEVPAGERNAHAVRQALTERTGRHVHPGQHGGRMSFEALPETAVSGHQLLVAHHPGRLEQRVEKRRGVTLGEDEMVVGRGVWVVPVVAQVTRHQHRDQVSRRHARGGMTRAGAGRGPDRVDPELRRQLCDGVEAGHLGHGFGRHGGSLGFWSLLP